MPNSVTFLALQERTRLPRVVSRAALARALARVGLTPESLDEANLSRALGSIYSTLRVYHDDAEAECCLERLRELCESGGHHDR